MTTVTPFLMFTGAAEQAVTRYVEVLPDSRVVSLERWPAGAAGPEGGVAQGEAVLAGQPVRFFDSPPVHAFSFTPSLSLFVTVDDPAEVDRIAEALGAEVLMPVGDHGFSRRFAWVNDPWGVSWQISAP